MLFALCFFGVTIHGDRGTSEQLKGEGDEATRSGVTIKSQKKMSAQTTQLSGMNTQYEMIV